ncbi:MAG: hypothetical protein DWQ02_00345 [Bacteroidetes bacterium]|nr:MAG: hypothetical protein DWQ02_00345 [Bacteroidota bacterium]
MKRIKFALILVFLITIGYDGFGQDSLWQRTYEFGIYNNYDLRNSSTNAISAYRLLNDGMDAAVFSKMDSKVGEISKGVFNFATIYLTMLWSHEFGHSIRAKQVGGKFNIHNFGLPVPYTTADLPEDIELLDEAIFVTGGFEVNYLNVRKLQSQFVRQNGLWNEDLSLSFANRLMYPIYTTLIVPIDPEEGNVWIETAGDPVHYILPVFKKYSNDQVFMEDGTVNPELVKLYNQASIFASFFHLLDPQFYREIGASFGNADKIRRPVFLIGDYNNGWTYGTLFNASPLGYELYMQNYINLKGNQFGVYLKYGRPFKNVGLGFSMNDVVKSEKFNADILLELWQQDIFGNGISAEVSGLWMLSERFGLNVNVGYKTEGYVLGKQMGSGLNLGVGFSMR